MKIKLKTNFKFKSADCWANSHKLYPLTTEQKIDKYTWINLKSSSDERNVKISVMKAQNIYCNIAQCLDSVSRSQLL